MDTRIQRTIDSSRLILSFGSTCLLQKAKQAEQQMKRYNELSEMLTPLFPEELTKEKLSVRLRQLKEKQSQLQQEEKEASENRQRLQLQVEELQRDGTLDELYQQASRQKQNYRNYWRNGEHLKSPGHS